jgi:uncharacterized protein YceK
MKTILALVALITLSGCGTLAQLQEQGREIRYGNPGNPYGFHTQTVSTPAGTYIIRGNRITGTQIYKNK